MNQLNAVLATNPAYVVIVFGVVILILSAIIMSLWSDLSDMKRRYKKMMTGVDGANLERMLVSHIDEVTNVIDEQKKLNNDIRRIDELLSKALTRVGIMRFAAFDNTGSDLSYAIAMLDSKNNGVVVSAICGRDSVRTYAKPIDGGTCDEYKLTHEEEKAVKEAMNKG